MTVKDEVILAKKLQSQAKRILYMIKAKPSCEKNHHKIDKRGYETNPMIPREKYYLPPSPCLLMVVFFLQKYHSLPHKDAQTFQMDKI